MTECQSHYSNCHLNVKIKRKLCVFDLEIVEFYSSKLDIQISFYDAIQNKSVEINKLERIPLITKVQF